MSIFLQTFSFFYIQKDRQENKCNNIKMERWNRDGKKVRGEEKRKETKVYLNKRICFSLFLCGVESKTMIQ